MSGIRLEKEASFLLLWGRVEPALIVKVVEKEEASVEKSLKRRKMGGSAFPDTERLSETEYQRVVSQVEHHFIAVPCLFAIWVLRQIVLRMIIFKGFGAAEKIESCLWGSCGDCR